MNCIESTRSKIVGYWISAMMIIAVQMNVSFAIDQQNETEGGINSYQLSNDTTKVSQDSNADSSPLLPDSNALNTINKPFIGPFWLELYSEGGVEIPFTPVIGESNNPTGYAETKAGQRFFISNGPVDLYGKIRLGRDLKGAFWNNRADAGLGIRVPFSIKGSSIQLFGEAITGSYLNSVDDIKTSLNVKNRKSINAAGTIPVGAFSEYRGGAVFWTGWGSQIMSSDKNWMIPLSPWGEIYSDAIFSSLNRQVLIIDSSNTARNSDNQIIADLIISLNPKIGFCLFKTPVGELFPYATGYGYYDTQHNWYNNKLVGGAGLRWSPATQFDFSVLGEMLWGVYTGVQRIDDINPNPNTWSSFKLSTNFWFGTNL